MNKNVYIKRLLSKLHNCSDYNLGLKLNSIEVRLLFSYLTEQICEIDLYAEVATTLCDYISRCEPESFEIYVEEHCNPYQADLLSDSILKLK